MDYIEYVIKAKMGDEKSLEWLIDRFQNMAVGYAYSILHDFQRAEDAAQEAFILLFRNIRNLKEPIAFISWLRKLIFNICYRILQRKKFEVSIDDIEEADDINNDFHQNIEHDEMTSLVKSALSQLNEGQREVFLLHYTFGKSYEEIAVDLQITVSAVSNRLYSGKKKLKSIMLNTMKEYLGGYNMNKELFTKKVLENIHNLITWHHGQNYLFNGCMEYLMECLHESKEYNYWFFSGVTGDSFTQLHRSDDYHKFTACLSANTFDYALAKKAFDACGYDFSYVNYEQISQDKKKWQQKIEEYINTGLPVIACGYKINEGFCVICGYDNEKDCVLILKGDDTSPSEYYNILDNSDTRVLLFVGDKKQTPPLADVYRQTVMNIPSFITRPPENGLFFGKQAFEDWANSFLDGRYADIDVTERDITWMIHGTYLCMAGTNGASCGFLNDALVYNPDMTFIERLKPIFDKQQIIFHELAYLNDKGEPDYKNGGIEGGFNIKAEKFKNPDIMRPVSNKILESAKYCDEILEVFRAL